MTFEQQTINGPTYGDFYAPKRGEDCRDDRQEIPSTAYLLDAARDLIRTDYAWLDDYCGGCNHCNRNGIHPDPLSVDCVKGDLILDDDAVYENACRQMEIDNEDQWQNPSTIRLLAKIEKALEPSPDKVKTLTAMDSSCIRMQDGIDQIIRNFEGFRDLAIAIISEGRGGNDAA